jgi:endonuclease/exonuclease/phosphatase family metal-dependent hydrolase
MVGFLISRRHALVTLVGSVVVPLVSRQPTWTQEASEPAADPSSGDKAVPRRIRVVSSNVRYGSADDGQDRWQLRKELLADVLRNENADLIGTQEMLPFQAEYLRQHLDGYAYVGRSRELDNDEGEQCGIFYRQARFVELEAGHFWLSPQPEQPGSQAWDAALPRMATWLKLFDRPAQRALVVINTHFDHRGHEARRHSAQVVRRFAQRYSDQYPIVVTGDFNCGEGSDPYVELVSQSVADSSPLVDVYRQVHPDKLPEEGTFNGFRGRRDGARIDWILATRDWQAMAADIVTANDQGRFPSDHFPVLAELEYSG